MRNRAATIEELQNLNPTLSKQEILAKVGLTHPKLTIDTDCHKKTTEERMEIKRFKKYHKQHGKKLNSKKAKHAFFCQSMKFKGKANKNLHIITL